MDQKSGKNLSSRDELESYQGNKLRETILHAYEHAPAARLNMERAGLKPEDIRGINDLQKIPVITKDQLVNLQRENPPFGGFCAVPIDDLEKIFVSPGPLYDAFTFKDGCEVTREILSRVGVGKGDRVIVTGSYHLVPPMHFVDEALRMLGATVIPAGIGNTELQVKIVHDLGVTGFFGFSSFLNALAEKAREMGYDLQRDLNLRFAIVAGEPMSASLRKTFEEEYGIDIREAYGTADIGFIAAECSEKSGMHLVTDLIVEILEPTTRERVAPGHVGEVVITSFDKAYPLIRFATGDLCSIIDGPCNCNNPTPRLGKIVGRVGEALRAKGLFIHAIQLKEVMAGFPQVSHFQLCCQRVREKDFLSLNLETFEGHTGETELGSLSESIAKRFQEVLRLRVDSIEFVGYGTIPAESKLMVDQRSWA